MATEYNERGIRFLYPENWQLSGDGEPGWPHCVSVHSPSGAFWALTVDEHPSDELFAQVLSAVSSEYEEVEQAEITRNVGPHTLPGVELHFYCLDFVVVAQVLHCPPEWGPMVLLLQAESREFETLGLVFDAILLSMKS